MGRVPRLTWLYLSPSPAAQKTAASGAGFGSDDSAAALAHTEQLHRDLVLKLEDMQQTVAAQDAAKQSLQEKLDRLDDVRRGGIVEDVTSLRRKVRLLGNRLRKMEQHHGQVSASNKHLVNRIKELRKERAVADTLWRNVRCVCVCALVLSLRPLCHNVCVRPLCKMSRFLGKCFPPCETLSV